MPSKRNLSLLNVRRFIEVTTEEADIMLKDNMKYPNGLVLPPAYVDMLREISFIGKAILRKHAAKNTRKDIYVESKRGEL